MLLAQIKVERGEECNWKGKKDIWHIHYHVICTEESSIVFLYFSPEHYLQTTGVPKAYIRVLD